MDEDFEGVYQQVQYCCPMFKWFACISWEWALFGKRGGNGLCLMQLWSRLIEGRSFWWVWRTFWTGFPEYVWLSSLWERKKERSVSSPALQTQAGYSQSCSEDQRWRSESWEVSVSGKVKIAPVSNCLAQEENRGTDCFIWKIRDREMTTVWKV